jgi:hypothetical protein
MKEFIKLKGTNYEFNQSYQQRFNSVVKQLNKDSIIYKHGKLSDIIDKLFKEPVKASIKPVDKIPVNTLQHGLKGTKKSDKTKQLMSKAKFKSIELFGVKYNSINEACKALNVNRSTVYRLNKKASIN